MFIHQQTVNLKYKLFTISYKYKPNLIYSNSCPYLLGISSILRTSNLLHDLHNLLDRALLLRILQPQPPANPGANPGTRNERRSAPAGNRDQTEQQEVQGPQRPEEL